MAFDTSVAIGLAAVSAIFAYLSLNIQKKHGVLQVLFLFLSVFSIFELLQVLSRFGAGDTNVQISAMLDQFYGTLIYPGLFLVGYFFISFLYNLAVDGLKKGRYDAQGGVEGH